MHHDGSNSGLRTAVTQKMESFPLYLEEIFFFHMDTQLLGIILVAFCF